MSTINSKTKVIRDSNMELLRIIAMLLVMIVHANFRALPVPTTTESNVEVLSSILRFFTESFSIICVNLFILLSGWYGIKLKIERLAEFIFQILFFSILGIVIISILEPGEHSIKKCIGKLLMVNRWDYWFVKSYLGLYLFSPILNSFVKHATKRQIQIVLILFYLFQTIYGWMFPTGAIYLEHGYSAMSFMGLYLLARYIRLYPFSIWKKSWIFDLLIYSCIVLVTTTITFLLKKYDLPYDRYFYFYTSPLVIIAAVHFLLIFTKIRIKSKVINWIACSCFAIYLLHSNGFLAGPYYDGIILNWFNQLSTLSFLLHVIPFIILVFVIAILLDKIRMFIWKAIITRFQS